MPTYTLELWRAIEIEPDIGLNDYPIFDASYREGLNKKIIDHYHQHEIGFETVGAFKFALARSMNEIMPLYNQLYLSEKLAFDPLKNIDMKTLSNTDRDMTSDASSQSETMSENLSKSRAVQMDTPQVPLSGNADYASGAADSTGATTGAGSGTEASESASREAIAGDSHTTGYQGSASAMLIEFRRTMLNIDMLIIDDLSDLFMGVWDNGDDYMPYSFTPLHI